LNKRIFVDSLGQTYNRGTLLDILRGMAEQINALFAGYIYPVEGIKTVTTSYAVQEPDRLILVNADLTVTLPDARNFGGKRISVKIINSGAGTRTVASSYGTIDGSVSITMNIQYQALDFVSDGTNWHIQ